MSPLVENVPEPEGIAGLILTNPRLNLPSLGLAESQGQTLGLQSYQQVSFAIEAVQSGRTMMEKKAVECAKAFKRFDFDMAGRRTKI